MCPCRATRFPTWSVLPALDLAWDSSIGSRRGRSIRRNDVPLAVHSDISMGSLRVEETAGVAPERGRLIVTRIVDLLSEAADVRSGRDGGFRLPDEWRLLALAVAGQPEGMEVVDRLAPAGSDPVAALTATAARMRASRAWPAGRVSAFVSDEDTPLGQWRTVCLGPRDDDGSRIALADTTTLFTALQMVRADDDALVTPLTVLDLAGFLDTACMYDRICFLENPHMSLAELEAAFGRDLFVELPVAST